MKPEADVPGMVAFLDRLKWDKNNLVAVIVQVCQRLRYMYYSCLRTMVGSSAVGSPSPTAACTRRFDLA